LPAKRKFTIDLSEISGSQVQVWGLNPRTGKARPAGQLATRGTRDFIPSDNAVWGLVCADMAKRLLPSGTTIIH
jgi:hypothetical protein